MTELTEFQRKLSALLPDVELRFEEALAKHTSFRIGGDADLSDSTLSVISSHVSRLIMEKS